MTETVAKTEQKREKVTVKTCGFDDNKRYFESVSIGDKPKFLSVKNYEFELVDNVTIEGKKVRPRPLKKTFDSLLFKAYDIVESEFDLQILFNRVYAVFDGFVNMSHENKVLASLIVFVSYFQEFFNWLPYLGVFGDNESGKTVLGDTLASLCYHGCILSSATSADIYQFFAEYEDSIPVLIEDEIQGLKWDSEKAKIYKEGNKKDAKVPRIVQTPYGRNLVMLSCFGLKVLIGEESPDVKGLKQRIIPIIMSKGIPKKNWYARTELDLIDLEKLKIDLLKWRMQTIERDLFKARIQDLKEPKCRIENNLYPLQAMCQFLENQKDFEVWCNNQIQKYREDKQETLQGVIVEVLRNLIGSLVAMHVEPVTNQIWFSFDVIWNEFKNVSEGEDVEFHKEKLQTISFGEITKKKVAQELTNLFDSKTTLKKLDKETMRVRTFQVNQLIRVFQNYLFDDEITKIQEAIKGKMNVQGDSVASN